MTNLYPEIEPYELGLLDVGDGNSIYWETCGNPHGKPAIVLHGGPGSGCIPWHRSLFDPSAYRLVLFDQRNCGRSTPHASALDTSLSSNTTTHLIADMEDLRQHLNIDCWLVFGGSWGSTLALAYAVRYPERVTNMILFGVTTGRHKEIDWLFRGGVAIFFPEQWDRLRMALPVAERDGDILWSLLSTAQRSRSRRAPTSRRSLVPVGVCDTFVAPVNSTRPAIYQSYICISVCAYRNPLPTPQCVSQDGILLRDADKLADIPGILVNGRYDFQAPIGNAWELKRVWPRAELVIVDNAGHAPDIASTTQEIIRATDLFALF